MHLFRYHLSQSLRETEQTVLAYGWPSHHHRQRFVAIVTQHGSQDAGDSARSESEVIEPSPASQLLHAWFDESQLRLDSEIGGRHVERREQLGLLYARQRNHRKTSRDSLGQGQLPVGINPKPRRSGSPVLVDCMQDRFQIRMNDGLSTGHPQLADPYSVLLQKMCTDFDFFHGYVGVDVIPIYDVQMLNAPLAGRVALVRASYLIRYWYIICHLKPTP